MMAQPVIVAACCALMIGLSILTPRVVDRVIYDDRPAMMIWDTKPVHTRLRPGEALEIEFRYIKRPECYPPHGSGEVEYRLWPYHPETGFARFSVIAQSISFAVPSTNGHRRTQVPLPVLPPGRYGIQSKAIMTCAGASKPQEVWTAMLQFDVID